MALSRNQLTSNYGSFHTLVEAMDDHGGYGNVTWNVGPHAGPDPYGHGYRVSFVPRDQLMAGYAEHPAHELERHASDIGQKMDRGDVVHVPHVKFKGGKPQMDVRHAAAIHAAGKRGAAHVPVVVSDDDQLSLMLHAGEVEKPGAPRAGQDARFKWRWNGRAWYTKPSFNNGQCPPGSKAGAGDQCLTGGPAPERKGTPKRAAAPSSDADTSDPAPRHRVRPSPAAVNQRARAAANQPAALAAPGAPAPSPPPQPAAASLAVRSPDADDPLPEPISRSDVTDHTALKRGGIGLDSRIFKGRDVIHKSMIESSKKAAEAMQRLAPHLQIGQFYGCGLSGCVYAAPEDPDGLPMVIKMDKGKNEASMANLMLKYRDLGRLSSVPRYVEAIRTGVVDAATKMDVYAIHREDLRDFKNENTEQAMKYHFGAFGTSIGHISRLAGSKTRKELLRDYDEMVKVYKTRHTNNPNISAQFDRVANDVRKLIARGVIPCDLHEGNWGIRPHTGEVVMRDVGCAHFSGDLKQ